MSDAVMVPRERDEAFCEAFYDSHLTHALDAMREGIPYQINADGAFALIRQAAEDRRALKALAASTPVGCWEGSRPQEAVPTEQAADSSYQWEARLLNGQWRVGLKGNLDTVHDATITVHKHGEGDIDQRIAEWVAEVHNASLQPAEGYSSNEGAAELRNLIASMAWRYRGSDRHGGPWYANAKPSDSPAMSDAFGFADSIIAMFPQTILTQTEKGS
jgi:hypothetical protein